MLQVAAFFLKTVLSGLERQGTLKIQSYLDVALLHYFLFLLLDGPVLGVFLHGTGLGFVGFCPFLVGSDCEPFLGSRGQNQHDCFAYTEWQVCGNIQSILL